MCSPILAGVTQTSLFRPSSVRVPPLGCPPEVDLPLCGIVIFSRQPESLPHLPRLRGRAWAPATRSSVSVSDFAREALHTPVSLRIPCFLQDRLFRHAAHGDGSLVHQNIVSFQSTPSDHSELPSRG